LRSANRPRTGVLGILRSAKRPRTGVLGILRSASGPNSLLRRGGAGSVQTESKSLLALKTAPSAVRGVAVEIGARGIHPRRCAEGPRSAAGGPAGPRRADFPLGTRPAARAAVLSVGAEAHAGPSANLLVCRTHGDAHLIPTALDDRAGRRPAGFPKRSVPSRTRV
jgi:hypothetical protein